MIVQYVNDSSGQPASGDAYIFFDANGRNNLKLNDADLHITSGTSSPYITNIGTNNRVDLNQDGYDDLVLGAKFADVINEAGEYLENAGTVYVLYGGPYHAPEFTAIRDYDLPATIETLSNDSFSGSGEFLFKKGETQPEVFEREFITQLESDPIVGAVELQAPLDFVLQYDAGAVTAIVQLPNNTTATNQAAGKDALDDLIDKLNTAISSAEAIDPDDVDGLGPYVKAYRETNASGDALLAFKTLRSDAINVGNLGTGAKPPTLAITLDTNSTNAADRALLEVLGFTLGSSSALIGSRVVAKRPPQTTGTDRKIELPDGLKFTIRYDDSQRIPISLGGVSVAVHDANLVTSATVIVRQGNYANVQALATAIQNALPAELTGQVSISTRATTEDGQTLVFTALRETDATDGRVPQIVIDASGGADHSLFTQLGFSAASNGLPAREIAGITGLSNAVTLAADLEFSLRYVSPESSRASDALPFVAGEIGPRVATPVIPTAGIALTNDVALFANINGRAATVTIAANTYSPRSLRDTINNSLIDPLTNVNDKGLTAVLESGLVLEARGENPEPFTLDVNRLDPDGRAVVDLLGLSKSTGDSRRTVWLHEDGVILPQGARFTLKQGGGSEVKVSVPAGVASLTPERLLAEVVKDLTNKGLDISVRLEPRLVLARTVQASEIEELVKSQRDKAGLTSEIDVSIEPDGRVVINTPTATSSVLQVIIPGGRTNTNNDTTRVLGFEHRESADNRGEQWFRINTLGDGQPGDYIYVSPNYVAPEQFTIDVPIVESKTVTSGELISDNSLRIGSGPFRSSLQFVADSSSIGSALELDQSLIGTKRDGTPSVERGGTSG